MAELKTKPTRASVTAFIDAIPEEGRRRDCRALVELMSAATGAKPKMWGPAIVGFGEYSYTGSNGRPMDWFLLGFSPRKAALTLYIMGGLERFPGIMKQLGKYKTGKSCLYVKQLADVDMKQLRELVDESVRFSREHERSASTQ